MKKIKYIELFSGIGAFTQAINTFSEINAECVFAADINEKCSNVYYKNYSINSLCDITKVDEKQIPDHDFCFFSPPCQAFSKSGFQKGFNDTRGTLIYDVFRILKEKKPKYILMENVRNLISHDSGNTLKVISTTLKQLGYRITKEPIILSPYYFGVPQTRDRAFLPGIYDPMKVNEPLEFNFEKFYKKEDCSIDDILDHKYDKDESLKISKHEEKVLNAWDEFYKGLDVKIIGFPVWSDFFYKNSYDNTMPIWKIDFIKKNRALYLRNKKHIDNWLKKYNYLENFTPTQKKFEWQCGEEINSIWDGIIQFRPSGVRVKKPNIAPALVAIVQIPIVGKLKRRLSVQECARLQSFSTDFIPDEDKFSAYKQLGNSINVKVLRSILEKMFNQFFL